MGEWRDLSSLDHDLGIFRGRYRFPSTLRGVVVKIPDLFLTIFVLNSVAMTACVASALRALLPQGINPTGSATISWPSSIRSRRYPSSRRRSGSRFALIAGRDAGSALTDNRKAREAHAGVNAAGGNPQGRPDDASQARRNLRRQSRRCLQN